MKSFVVLVILSVALTSWARYIATSQDYGYDYGLGLSSTIHFKPSYTTSKPVYVNSWKPLGYYGYKPYTGHGSSYGYGLRPSSKPTYITKPTYIYRPYYGYKPYYGYESSYLYGQNPYYYGSYDHGLGYGHGLGYTDLQYAKV